ncbi:MAG: Hpt domain-containing protein [Hyphomicrobiales bacterium]|nr:Hpt domain-containing protein [Hyphomicrobiales bacterium]
MNASMLQPAAQVQPPFDLVLLSRQTAGDDALERELLAMFGTQAAEILARLDAARQLAAPRIQAELAHRLRGSALAVCALEVASQAGQLESALLKGCGAAQASKHFEALAAAVARAETSLASLLAA